MNVNEVECGNERKSASGAAFVCLLKSPECRLVTLNCNIPAASSEAFVLYSRTYYSTSTAWSQDSCFLLCLNCFEVGSESILHLCVFLDYKFSYFLESKQNNIFVSIVLNSSTAFFRHWSETKQA